MGDKLKTMEGIVVKHFFNMQPCDFHDICAARAWRIALMIFDPKIDCRFNDKMRRCEYYLKYSKNRKPYHLDQL